MMSPDPNRVEQLMRSYTPPVPDADFANQLEARLAAAGPAARPRRGRRLWLGAALVAAAALLAAIVIAVRPDTPRRETVLALEGFDDGRMCEEKRQVLSWIVDDADLIVAGRVTSGEYADGRFGLRVYRVLKGDPRGATIRVRRPGLTACPAPPTIRPDVWVVLFVRGGSVFSDQYKPEFEREADFTGFVNRVWGYLDGSIVTTLLAEMEVGGGRAPYGEMDRLSVDVVNLLVLRRDAAGLLAAGARWPRRLHLARVCRQARKIGGGRLLRDTAANPTTPEGLRLAIERELERE